MLERFRNPFIKHELLSIALNLVSKWKVRVLPSLSDYLQQTGRLPPALAFSLAALIHFYRGTSTGTSELCGKRGDDEYPIRDEPATLKCFEKAWDAHRKTGSTYDLVATILSQQSLWASDLSKLPGLTDAVSGGLEAILRHGTRGTVQAILQDIQDTNS